MKIYLCLGYDANNKMIVATCFFKYDDAEEFMQRYHADHWQHGWREVY